MIKVRKLFISCVEPSIKKKKEYAIKKEGVLMGQNIVVIGSMNQDIIMKISRMPELGESMMVDECILAAGGKGSNQAVQAAKLGADVSMIGSVGKDAMG